MKTKTFEDVVNVRHGEVDRQTLLRFDSYFEYMQDVAAAHADELGIGLRLLTVHQMLWVLSRLKLSILRNASIGEKLRIRTWPSGMEKLFATREFEIFSLTKQDVVARASSCWLMLDAVKYRPVRHSAMLEEALPDNSDLPRFFTGLDKIKRIENPQMPLETEVRESMIDANQHLNNARCAAIVFDWLAKATGKGPKIQEIQLNFIASTQVGTQLTTTGLLDGENFLVEAIAEGEATPRFQAQGLLQN